MAKVNIKVEGPDETQPFLRGLLTHSLVKRGMPFYPAYEIARKVRIRLEEKASGKQHIIHRSDLKEIVDAEISSMLGVDYLAEFRSSKPRPKEVVVRKDETTYPFSKGLLARALTGAGIDPEDSYEMARQVESNFLRRGQIEVSEEELGKNIRARIVMSYGESTARFYDLARQINHLDKPVIIYLAGAAGTGKSTLATELAARLGIMKATGTDMVREIMRIVFSEEILPSLYGSSFKPKHTTELDQLELEDRFIAAMVMQSTKVCVGVKAAVERAVKERMNIVLEGVHLLPGLLQFEGLMDKAYHLPIILSLMSKGEHKSRLANRTLSRNPERYTENFKRIREIHDYFVEQASVYDVDLINNIDYDVTIREIIQIVLERLGEKIEASKQANAPEPV